MRHFSFMEQTKTVIVIVGPTAVGKTAFAIEVAKLLRTEIISADSRQCYKELNIGVAKPSLAELQEVKHHFINSHSIHEEVNAVVFEQYALQSAKKIFTASDVAVMVGGTGLYVKAFCEGLDDIPAADENIRKRIITEFEAKGLGWLQKEVAEKDPGFWATAEQQNPQRLMRALEIKETTGKSITHFRNGHKQSRPFNIIKIGLELPREELYNRINTRVDKMIEQGLVEEVKELLPYKNLNALQTVGYKEIFQSFEGLISINAATEEIKRNSRHYAKRQLTWFKKDQTINWFSSHTSVSEVIEQVFTT
jgi:tRNA dimethylallyltransferase